MRILQVCPYFAPTIGGIQYYVLSLSREMQRRGHLIEILTVDSPPGTPTDSKAQDIEGIAVTRCPLDRYYHKGLVSREFLCNAIKDRRRFDIYHVHVPFPLGLEVSLVAARFGGAPVVVTHHGEPTGERDLIYNAIRGSYFFISRWLLRNFPSRVVFLTDGYGRSLGFQPSPRGRFRTVATGVDCASFSPSVDGTRVRDKYGIPSDQVVILFVGSLAAHNEFKGVPYLLKALSRLSPSHLAGTRTLIVGGGDLVTELKNLSNSLGVEERVIFVGSVEHCDLPAYYAAADIFVLPSIAGPENAPLVLLEAMASGKASVCSALPGITDIIHDGKTGMLVCPKDVQSLKDAIVHLVDNAGIRTSLGTRARDAVQERSWERTGLEMESLYRELLTAKTCE